MKTIVSLMIFSFVLSSVSYSSDFTQKDVEAFAASKQKTELVSLELFYQIKIRKNDYRRIAALLYGCDYKDEYNHVIQKYTPFIKLFGEALLKELKTPDSLVAQKWHTLTKEEKTNVLLSTEAMIKAYYLGLTEGISGTKKQIGDQVCQPMDSLVQAVREDMK